MMVKKTATKRDFSLALGRVLYDIRKNRDLSQEAFGNLLGIHRTHVGFLERGERTPNLFTLLEIAVALDMPLEDLVKKIVDEYKAHSDNLRRQNKSTKK